MSWSCPKTGPWRLNTISLDGDIVTKGTTTSAIKSLLLLPAISRLWNFSIRVLLILKGFHLDLSLNWPHRKTTMTFQERITGGDGEYILKNSSPFVARMPAQIRGGLSLLLFHGQKKRPRMQLHLIGCLGDATQPKNRKQAAGNWSNWANYHS